MATDLLLAFVLGWLVPGAGHWCLGKRGKAVMIFVLITALFAGGLVLAGFRNVRMSDNPLYVVGQAGCGLVFFVCSFWTSYVPRFNVPAVRFEIGLLYICVAGLLNFVVMLNLLDVRDSVGRGRMEGAGK
jgi:hypothetical protein